jgi:hypothetical protein
VLKEIEALLHGFFRHYLSAVWAGINMTVSAPLITHLAYVHLQDLKLSRFKW